MKKTILLFLIVIFAYPKDRHFDSVYVYKTPPSVTPCSLLVKDTGSHIMNALSIWDVPYSDTADTALLNPAGYGTTDYHIAWRGPKLLGNATIYDSIYQSDTIIKLEWYPFFKRVTHYPFDTLLGITDGSVLKRHKDYFEWNASQITGLADSLADKIHGSGTAGYAAIFSDTKAITDSNLYVDASGNWGIGTDAPDSKLTVLDGSSNDDIVRVYGADLTEEYLSLGCQRGVGSNNEAVIAAGNANGTSTDLVFKTSSLGAEAEFMRIKGNGNIGLYQNNPLVAIHMGGAVRLDICADADDDYDKIVVLDASGNVDYRTGAELLTDLSGDAGATFGWNNQDLTGVGTLTATTVSATNITSSNFTSGYLPYYDGSKLTNSVIYELSSKIGIGTTNPTATATGGKLVVRNDVDYTSTEFEDNATLLLNNETNGSNACLILHADNSGNSSKRAGIILFPDDNYLGIYGDVSNQTNSISPQLIIAATGNVGIGTSSPSTELDVDGTITCNSIYASNLSTSTGTDLIIDGNEICKKSSSKRYKKYIRNYDIDATEIISKIKLRKFKWRNKKEVAESHRNKMDWGFIAEELVKINSDLVTYNGKEQIESWDSGKMICLLVKEIQSLRKEVDSLKALK